MSDFIPEAQVYELLPFEDYAVAHQHGPTYTGPSGGFLFSNGLPIDPESGQILERIPGHRVAQNGLALIVHLWVWRPGHHVFRDRDSWVYRPALEVPAPFEPPPDPEPDKRRCSGKTAAGKPCGSWAVNGGDFCRHHGDA